MKKISSMADVLDFAIAGENESAELYMKMAMMVKNPWIQKTLEGLAAEELAGMDYRELLVFVIKKENISYNLYMKLAVIFPEPELQDTFLKLAKEEAEHKRRFEMEYELLTS